MWEYWNKDKGWEIGNTIDEMYAEPTLIYIYHYHNGIRCTMYS